MGVESVRVPRMAQVDPAIREAEDLARQAADALALAASGQSVEESAPVVVVAALRLVRALEYVADPHTGICLNPERDPWADEERRCSISVLNADESVLASLAQRLQHLVHELSGRVSMRDEEDVVAVVDACVEIGHGGSPSVGGLDVGPSDAVGPSVGAASGVSPSGTPDASPEGVRS